MNSRDFHIEEISHGPLKHPMEAAFQMGYMQAQRDRLTKKYKRPIRLSITSGDRTGYNASVPGAAKDSFHMWGSRPFGGQEMVVTANDFTCPDLPLEELFKEIYQTTIGEVYLNYDQSIVHCAPCGPDEHFIRRNGVDQPSPI